MSPEYLVVNKHLCFYPKLKCLVSYTVLNTNSDYIATTSVSLLKH